MLPPTSRSAPSDASILWTATIPQFKGIERIPEPILDSTHDTVSACVLKDSKDPTAALAFCRYHAAPDRGGKLFSKHGYTQVPGDGWSEHPAFTLFSGAVNLVAIDDLVRQFEDREGAAITTVYNGCGILCASMKALAETPGAHVPDAPITPATSASCLRWRSSIPRPSSSPRRRSSSLVRQGQSQGCALAHRAWPSLACAWASATPSSPRWASSPSACSPA